MNEAIACYERALEGSPDHGEAYNNLGSVFQQQGHLAESLACFQKALLSKPDFANAYSNLGTVLQEQGQLVKAIACYAKSLRLAPEFAEAHYNRAMILLCQENFGEGWAEFEWRLKCATYPRREFNAPRWDGSRLAGGTLLVHAEQGLGDTLMFVRFLSEARKRCGNVVLEVPAALVPLLHASGFTTAVAFGTELPPCHAHASLLSLPGIFQTTLATIPAEGPYLAADPERIEHWTDKLSETAGLKIGIGWQGNRSYACDRNRSIPLGEFAPLAGAPGVRLFSLQKGDGSEQLAESAGRFSIDDLGGKLDEEGGAFMDTAAVMKNLDLVITSDTAIAHLAGALGVKTWVALPLVPDWRWFLTREDCPWYPTMRLFRQRTLGRWDEVFDHMARVLADHV
jgi:hypothetical protein